MRSAKPRVSVSLLRGLLGGAEKLGVSRERVLAALGLSEAMLEAPDAMLDGERLLQGYELAAHFAGDPLFGLHLGEVSTLGNFELMDYLFVSSRNAMEALERSCRYYQILSDQMRLTLTRSDATVTLRLQTDADRGEGARHAWEALFASGTVRLRYAMGRDWRPLRLSFAHRRGGDSSEYERVFGVEPTFSVPVTEAVLDVAPLVIPFKSADAALARLMILLAEQQYEARSIATATLSRRVRDLALSDLADVSVSSISKRLGMTARTMQRRIEDEGTTFKQVIDEARKHVAIRTLSESRLSVKEVATLLGFQQPQAFFRAFRRWTGETPLSFRARATSGRAGEAVIRA